LISTLSWKKYDAAASRVPGLKDELDDQVLVPKVSSLSDRRTHNGLRWSLAALRINEEEWDEYCQSRPGSKRKGLDNPKLYPTVKKRSCYYVRITGIHESLIKWHEADDSDDHSPNNSSSKKKHSDHSNSDPAAKRSRVDSPSGLSTGTREDATESSKTGSS
jgi:hypothetical protein